MVEAQKRIAQDKEEKLLKRKMKMKNKKEAKKSVLTGESLVRANVMDMEEGTKTLEQLMTAAKKKRVRFENEVPICHILFATFNTKKICTVCLPVVEFFPIDRFYWVH